MRTEKQIKKLWDTNKPTISVVCTTFNQDKYISQCIDSILTQKTSFPFEIIVYNDCSTDKTEKIISLYHKKYPSIIKPIHNRKNLFLSNEQPDVTPLSISTGLYFASCEGDDYWCNENKLETQASFLEENKDFACCFHDYLIFDQNINKFFPGYNRSCSGFDIDSNSVALESILKPRKIIIRAPTKLMTRDAVIAAGEIRKKYTNKSIKIPGDNFLTAIMPSLGKTMYFGSLKAAVFRRHNESSWNPTSMAYKNEMRMHLGIALTKFFSDQKDKEMAEYWHQESRKRLDLFLSETISESVK